MKFKTLVKNLFSSLIKQLQSDGGGEFLSNQFKYFIESNGITHRISCPYTGKHNVLTKRKHRHIVEMDLAMLAQYGMSKVFWVASFLTIILWLIGSLLHCLNIIHPFWFY